MRKLLLLLSLLPVVVLIAESDLFAQTLEMTVIDVGQGDSILIEFPAGDTGARKRMLIDGGPSSSTNNAVVKLLNDKGITELDVVVLTHPHSDHYLGLTPVLNTFTVREFWWTGERRGPPRDPNMLTTWRDFETAMDRAGSKVTVRQGDEWSSQSARIEILNAGGEYPDTPIGEDINNDSLVMLLYYKSVKVLFTGDIEADEGWDLVNDYCNPSRSRCRKLDVDVLKIPHHGSGHLSPGFVKFVRPEHVLVSAGFRNVAYHHPRKTALLAYHEAGAKKFYSTSKEGDNNISVSIGPDRRQLSVNGATSGFTYWRELDPEEPNDQCGVERDGGYCLELWP